MCSFNRQSRIADVSDIRGNFFLTALRNQYSVPHALLRVEAEIGSRHSKNLSDRYLIVTSDVTVMPHHGLRSKPNVNAAFSGLPDASLAVIQPQPGLV